MSAAPDGWLLLDKPAGPSSARCVAIVKRMAGGRKCGHGGTLDPQASGLLPIAIGEATKTVDLVMGEGRKTYEFGLRFGAQTSTDDCEGEILDESPVRPSPAELAAVLGEFRGEIEQTPPAFSAVHVGGERAYAKARRGERPDMPARRVTIHALELLGFEAPDLARLRVECGGGTYVRSLARDIARALGALGHVAWLCRTRIGRFPLSAAISLEKLQALGHIPAEGESFVSLGTALDDIPALALSACEAEHLRHGRAVRREANLPGNPQLRVAWHANLPLALVRWEEGWVRPARLLNVSKGVDDVD